jgi:predicted nucleic acid-binding protein
MARYLLDTNHVSAVLDGRSALRERLYQSLKLGHRIGTCVPVLCELETGIHQTRRRDHNRRVPCDRGPRRRLEAPRRAREVLVEQILAVGDIAGLDGQHVGGDDRVERAV